MKTCKILVFALIILTAGITKAHDFWLLPDFHAQAGKTFKIVAHTGDNFPSGESAVALDRIARFEIHGSDSKAAVTKLQAGTSATEAESLLLKEGTYVVITEIKPRFLELEAGEFKSYLEHEGLTKILAARAAGKNEDQPGRELYAKFAKSIFHLGEASGGMATQPMGLKLEIIPEIDPSTVPAGQELPVKVLFDGEALDNVQVACISDTSPGSVEEKEDFAFTTRTNYQGIAYIPISNPGTWMIRLVHMIPASDNSDHDWESFFSTLTFYISPENGFPLTVDSIMRGYDLVGNGPSSLRWSGDSSRLYFNWRKPGESEANTYVVTRDGNSLRKLSEDEAKEAPPASGSYTEDGSRVTFAEYGDIVIMDTITNKRENPLRTTATELSPRFTKDEKHITIVRESNLFRLSLVESLRLEQLTDLRGGPQRQDPKLSDNQLFLEEQQKELFELVRERAEAREKTEKEREARQIRKAYYYPREARISGLQLSPDQTRVIFSQSESPPAAKSTIVPNYVTSSGYTEDIRARVKVGDEQGKSKMGLISVETGEVVWIAPEEKDGNIRLSNPIWSESGEHLVVVGLSRDNKDRFIYLVDQETGKTKILDFLHDDAWVLSRGFGSSFGWMPDNRSIYFISEKDGYLHLYTVALDGTPAKALTTGKFEVFSSQLSKDKSRFYFTSSEVHPGERHLYSMPATGGARTRHTNMPGNNRVYLSPDEKTAATIYSYSNKPPELYLMNSAPDQEAKQITTTPTEEWRSFPWVDPKLITFKARDGAEVYARVYTPEMLNEALGRRATPVKEGVKRPGVIFVHGAGYTQNAHRYWASYFREYMFHHILMDKGYVVMDIDYRGSSGYGRDWRTGIYRHMGGKDLDDQVDGARWMVESLNVDPARIGLYGGSYGGFITLMAMFTEPDVFAAGASLRPVTDWAHYNHRYTSNILNQPQDDEEAYKRSSPIYFAEGLKGALLICHGMVDTNVHFEDTVRLAERLIELRKENWEVAMYPVESHGFQRSDSWADEYKRILKLFETNLKVR